MTTELTKVRCKGCGKLLGEFKGCGVIKCRSCRCITEFDTEKGWAKARTVAAEWAKPTKE